MAAPEGQDEDAALVAAARKGDREAWVRLMKRHAPRLASYLGARLRRPLVVEKLVEDAIVLAHRHLEEIEDDTTFPGWFRRVGAHLALRWYREHSEEPLTEPFPVDRCPDDGLRDRLSRLEQAMSGLTDIQRMTVEQRYRGGLDGEDLAEVLHCDRSKAERMVEDALLALEREWRRVDGESGRSPVAEGQ